MRRFAKMLFGQVGRGSSVVLRPTASQDRCQGAMQGLEESPSKTSFTTIPACGRRTSLASLRLRCSIGVFGPPGTLGGSFAF
jgi:hypothetical protein